MQLLDNGEFVADLHRALAGAQCRVLVQVMTFDGDASGLAVAELLESAAGRGVDVRLLVDCFALRYVSDRKATEVSALAEAAETKAMFERLRTAGVAVTFTQPFGPVVFFGLSRNHKKLYVVDDHAYLGGINISDHNFAWRDFMVRIDDRATVAAIAEDFARTELGDRGSVNGTIITNREIEPVFTQVVGGARRRLVLASPYSLDVGIVKLLCEARAPSKTVIAAQHNNYRWLRLAEPYIWNRLARAGVELCTYRDFFHARFLLADDDTLLVGSSNFSRHSFRCNQEVGLLITDRQFIDGFKARMLADTGPLEAADRRRNAAAIIAGAAVARFYFHAVIGAAQLVAPLTPALSTRA